jgi:hypothetical protein
MNEKPKKFKAGDLVRVTKVSGKPDAALPEGYSATGRLGQDLVEGATIDLWGNLGVRTTPAVLVTYDGENTGYAHTKNSMWRVERLEK